MNKPPTELALCAVKDAQDDIAALSSTPAYKVSLDALIIMRHLETIQAALNLLAEKAEEGWQPIETAPRDGTKVLVLNNCGSQLVARYEDDQWLGFPGHRNVHFPLIHWMPLPEPPSVACEEEERSDNHADTIVEEFIEEIG